jgi:oligogalacturonide lyase
MFKSFSDPLTSRPVTKLSPDGVLCHHPYFYNRMFSSGSRFLIYAREEGNIRCIHRLDLESGESRLLIGGGGPGEVPVDDFGPNLSADENSLFYCRGNRVIRHEIDSGKEDTIYESPAGWHGYTNPSLSSDDRFMVTIEMLQEDAIRSTGNWDTFEPQWRKNPLCRLVLVDVEKKTAEVIHQEKLWLGHPQFRPHHNNDISYCHEGPATLIDARLWFIHADGSGIRCLHEQKEDEIITHEFWLADGSKLGFVYRKMAEPVRGARVLGSREIDNVQQKIFYVDTDDFREEFIMDCSVYCHSITSPDSTLMAGDGQQLEKPYIYLANLQDKTETILCRHDTSWKPYRNTQDAHPHPAFSPDGKKIVFTSDRDGLPGIYMIQV